MTFRIFKLIKSPGEIKGAYPLTPEDFEFVQHSQKQISSIICGSDPRTLIIAGPCSIHDEESALQYAERLHKLQELVKDKFMLVMRFYFEKPRTKTGWKGILYDPSLDGSENLEEGLEVTRKLMSKITEMRVPIASEIVDPMAFYYFDDLISWLCIGARTSSSQSHRQNTSGMGIAVGYKNDLSGSVINAVNSIVASDTSHTFMGIDNQGKVGVYKSSGSPFAHLVLRGSKGVPNFSDEAIKHAIEELDKAGLMTSVVIDCSHDNCDKNYEKMPNVFKNVIEQIRDGNESIRGLMLESHLLSGNQTANYDGKKLLPGVSITDPCISWETTEELINWAYQQLNQGIHAIH